MYIEIHDWKEFEQKVLYYKLNNSFNMNLTSELNHKIAGIYAIYKDDICLYVGQSKNLGSRLATHLKGKYENATNIYVWNIEAIGFSEFRAYKKELCDQILIRCEKYLMSVLKPIENLDIDMSFHLQDMDKPSFNFSASSCYTIQNDRIDLKITDSYPHLYQELIIRLESLYIGKSIDRSIYDLLKNDLDCDEIKYFYNLGVQNAN